MTGFGVSRLDSLAAAGDWSAYGRELAQAGCGWWFRMDIPRIEGHLRVFLEHQSAGLSPRLRLLEGIVTPLPGAEKLPGILSTLSALHRVLLLKRDLEAAAVCSGLALAAVWDFGTDLALARPWLRKAAEHLARPALPALARAHLLAFSGLFRLFLDGDVPGTRGLLDRQARAAVDADCAELTVYGASVRALAELFAGDGPRGELLLDDARPFLDRASTTSHARVYYELVRGVILNGIGRPEDAVQVLDAAAELLPEAWMPVSMRVQLAGYRLMAAALLRDEAAVARFEERVRALAVADRNHFHAAFMHFSLGAAHFRRDRPYRALVHAQAGEELGRAARSPIPILLNAVLAGQAFAELNEGEEAESAFHRVDEQGAGLVFFRRAVAVERAHRALQGGGTDEARTALEAAGFRGGDPDAVLSPFRSPRFNRALRERLRPSERMWRFDPECRIRVATLGWFAVTVDGDTVYDRRWRSGRSQQLLKLLVALGGTRVPVDGLTDELWPDANGDQAYANFKTTLARLRRVAGGDGGAPRWILLRYGRLSLSRALVGVDALRFLDRARAYRACPEPAALPALIEAYTGPFLPRDDHCAVLGRFRMELRNRFVEGVEQLVAASAAGETRVDLPAYLARAVELAPDAEVLHALRVRALLDDGYRIEALNAYLQAEAHFRNRFGVAPGDALGRLGARAGARPRPDR